MSNQSFIFVKIDKRFAPYVTELKHNIGDTYFYIDFGEDGFSPCVKESGESVGEIRFSKSGLREKVKVGYYTSDGLELDEEYMNANGMFWTKEQAEKWFAENVPAKPSFTRTEDVIWVEEGKLYTNSVRRMIVRNGKLCYQCEKAYQCFTEEEIGVKAFTDYLEAKAARDKQEAEKFHII